MAALLTSRGQGCSQASIQVKSQRDVKSGIKGSQLKSTNRALLIFLAMNSPPLFFSPHQSSVPSPDPSSHNFNHKVNQPAVGFSPYRWPSGLLLCRVCKLVILGPTSRMVSISHVTLATFELL